jgi:putative ABC transport system ATP-binding protein
LWKNQVKLSKDMPIIELRDVSKLYGFGDATNLALDEVNLTIEEGEFVAIMGPSGSGKSTLMNIIGLLDRPTHGNYLLNGRSVDRLRPSRRAKARRDTIGFVFQSFNLLPKLNVIENVGLPLAYKGVPLNKRIKNAENILERVGMRDRAFYYPKQLSSGQTQSAAIARALVNNPRIIIADEPTGNLDSAASRLVMELFAEIHRTGSTILLVTHNPELTRYASRVVYVHDGSIVNDERTEIGKVAKTARRVMYTIPTTTEEDDLAGVSALMNAIPDSKDTTRTKAKGRKRTAKKPAPRRTKSKAKK